MLIVLSLLFTGAQAFCAPQIPQMCANETEKLLTIPSRAVKLNSHREEVEAQIRETVEHGILQNAKVKSAELRLIPHWRYFRASYSGHTSSGMAHVDTIADEQGVIQSYKLLKDGKAQYWCRNGERASP